MTENRDLESSGLVSVIIPTYYRNESLKSTIESVRKQTYEPLELIVVDDSGENHAEAVVEHYDATYIAHDQNQGAMEARNTGIRESSGEYIQLLDDDDQLATDKIEKQVERLENSENVGVVYCGLVISEKNRAFLPNPRAKGDVLSFALSFNLWPCINSTMLISRDVLYSIYPLQHRLGADDVGTRIELAQRTDFDYLEEALVYSGNAKGSRGQSVDARREHLDIMEEYQELYGEFPDRIRQLALYHSYEGLADSLLEEHLWSLHAIIAYAKACYYKPDFDVKCLGLCLAAIFGQPGKRALKFGWRKVKPNVPRMAQ